MPIAKMHPFGHVFGVSVLLGPAPLPSNYQNCTCTCVLVFGALVPPTKIEHENTQGVFVLSGYPSTSPPYTPTPPTP